MLAGILATVGAAVGGQVIKYLQEQHKLSQFERMQSEVLEGWVYKLEIAVREGHMRNNVSPEIHKEVMKGFHRVVKKEIDSRNI